MDEPIKCPTCGSTHVCLNLRYTDCFEFRWFEHNYELTNRETRPEDGYPYFSCGDCAYPWYPHEVGGDDSLMDAMLLLGYEFLNARSEGKLQYDSLLDTNNGMDHLTKEQKEQIGLALGRAIEKLRKRKDSEAPKTDRP